MKINSYLALGAVAAGVFTGVGAANAATISSELKLSGTLDATALGVNGPFGNPLTTFEFDDIGGNPNVDTGEFVITEGNGPLFQVFNPLPFEAGTIRDLPIPLNDPTGFFPVEDFLDFSFDPLTGDPLDEAQFNLDTMTDVTAVDTGVGVTTSFSVLGTFDTAQGTFNGEGTFSADITYDAIAGVSNFAEYTTFLSTAGNRIEGIAYSADFIVEQEVDNGVVPESSNVLGLLGLGLLGGTMVASKKRK